MSRPKISQLNFTCSPFPGTSGSELPKKKPKVFVDGFPNLKEVKAKPEPSAKPQDATSKSTTTQPAPAAARSKKSRKRAADFLSDDEDGAPEVSSSKVPPPNASTAAGKAAHKAEKRKRKKAKKDAERAAKASETLTADGVNGVTESKKTAKVKIDTAKKPAAKSMQAEAQHTNDQELEDEWGGFDEEEAAKATSSEDDEEEDQDEGYLLDGFDSDSPDREDEDFDGKIPDIGDEGRKKMKAIKGQSLSEEPGIVYLGRIPHGFYETEMRSYLGQFGEITKLRLARNKRTGASKHFAFVEFASKDVAKIVAEANNNYMMFGHILKCSPVTHPEELHPDLWKGANKKFRRIPHEKIEREKLAAPKSVEEWEKKNTKEQKKRDKKAKKLKEIGYEMPEIKLRDPKEAVEEAKLFEQKSDETVPAIEDGKTDSPEQPTKAIENAKNATAKPDEKAKNAIAVVNGEAEDDVKTNVGAKDPAGDANVEAKEAQDTSKLSKKEKKALRKAEKAKEEADAAKANGEATPAEKEPVVEEKPTTTTAKDDKSSKSEPSSKPKSGKDTASKDKKSEVKGGSAPGGKDHKNDKKPDEMGKRAKKTAKSHEKKKQRLAEENGKAEDGGKKVKKDKKRKESAA